MPMLLNALEWNTIGAYVSGIYLMAGGIVLLIGAVLSTVIAVRGWFKDRIRNQSGRWFNTFSEMVSIWEEPQGRVFFSFALISLFLILATRFPLILRFHIDADVVLGLTEELIILSSIILTIGCPIALDRRYIEPPAPRIASEVERTTNVSSSQDSDARSQNEPAVPECEKGSTGEDVHVGWDDAIMYNLHCLGAFSLFLGFPAIELVVMYSDVPPNIRHTDMWWRYVALCYTTLALFGLVILASIPTYLSEEKFGCVSGPAPNYAKYLSFTAEFLAIVANCTIIIMRGYWAFSQPQIFFPAGGLDHTLRKMIYKGIKNSLGGVTQ